MIRGLKGGIQAEPPDGRIRRGNFPEKIRFA
ncbi:MAG: hypothetical protein KatS3mg005_1923 [Bryobacteraceae bacterium]|nr:MAG: hypothetical protein KatS3mg005_1923 [Bryobacteraceae bacterium]